MRINYLYLPLNLIPLLLPLRGFKNLAEVKEGVFYPNFEAPS